MVRFHSAEATNGTRVLYESWYAMYMIDKLMSLAMYSWSNKEYEESLILALIGIGAVSKLHYPTETDRQAYEMYLKTKLTEVISRYLGDVHIPEVIKSFKVNDQDLEQILYKTLRCKLIHELRFPDNVRLMDSKEMSASIETHSDGTIVFGNRLPLALIYTVLDDALVLDLRVSGGQT